MFWGLIAALTRRFAGFLSLLFAAGLASAQTPSRIVAVGDLHGDFKAWQDIARAAGIIDGKGHWAGGKTILVQLGDILDRGGESLKIVRNLQQLQREAPRKGGKVYVVLGNHEAMNLIGDDRYVMPGEYAAFTDSQSAARRDRVYEANRAALEAAYRAQDPKITPAQVRAKWMAEHPLGWAEHQLAWGPAGDLGKWATRNPAILKLGDILFVHGGISQEYAREPLDALNKRIAAAMAAADDSPTSVLTDPLSPLWYRGLVMADPEAAAARAKRVPPMAPVTAEQELATVLAAYGAGRMVVGHTPNLRGIVISPDSKLARIDTGNSRYYGGTPSWLEIIGDRMVPHTTARTP